MFRCNISNQQGQQFKHIGIFRQAVPPRYIVHIGKVNFDFPSEREQLVRVLILGIELVHIGNIRQIEGRTGVFIKAVNRFYRAVYQILDACQRQIERIDGAFHTLHQVDGGQATDTLLTARLRKADIDLVISVQFSILLHLTWQNVVRRRIDRQCQKHKLLKNLVVADCFLQVSKMWTKRDRL